MAAKKAQMFVATAVFLTGLLFFVQQALLSYSILDLSGPYQTKEHYIAKNVVDIINYTIMTTADCHEFENNLKELLSDLRTDFGSEGYMIGINYDLNCSRWNYAPPADAPLTLSITFTGNYDASGIYRLHNRFSAACPRQNPGIGFSPPSHTATPGEQVSYIVRVINNDDSSCGSSTFSLTADCPSGGWTCSLDEPSLTIAPGSTQPVKLDVTSPLSATSASYPVSVTATNTANPSYSGTGSGTYIIP